jgi:hypothetical protein
MGYRSEVVLAFDPRVKPLLACVFAKHSQVLALCLDGLVSDDDDAIYYRWDYIKWHEGHPQIAPLVDFMDKLDNEDVAGVLGDELYRFVRVGEDCDDLDDRGHGFGCDITPVTSIHVDYG